LASDGNFNAVSLLLIGVPQLSYRSGKAKTWLKIKNPKSPARRRIGVALTRRSFCRNQNRILASLSAASLEAINPHLKLFDLKQGDVLVETKGLLDRVYFPHNGVISLVVELKEGDLLETAMVGRDGVLGATAALDGKISLNKAIVQGSGSLRL
jgi:hypothetical protein